MSAWQVLSDSFITAAELAALLFISPVSAMEPTRTERAPITPAMARARELHLLSSSLNVRLLGSLADVRISQQFRNDSGETLSLGGRLPAVDEHTDALRIHRKGRIIDLLQTESGCEGEEGDDDEDLQADLQGHARLAVDETIADALQLAPGETASIELIATQSLARVGATYLLPLPAQASIGSQALLVDQTDTRFLVVVPHHDARGTGRLTLRPAGAGSETIELGKLSEVSQAYVIPLASHAALQALAAGAIELETRSHDRIVWSTLPVHVRNDTALTLATSKE